MYIFRLLAVLSILVGVALILNYALAETSWTDCDITWDANPPEELVTGYAVGWNGEYNPPVTTTRTTCLEQGIDPNARGLVTVKAYNATGESPPSAPVFLGEPEGPPSATSGVRVTPRTEN